MASLSTENLQAADNASQKTEVKSTAEQATQLIASGKAQLAFMPGKALNSANQALSISRQLGNRALEIESLLLLAECQRSLLADYDKAVSLAEEASTLAKSLGRKDLMIEAAFSRGISYRDIGNSYGAIETFKLAESLSREAKQTAYTIQALNQLGQIFNALGQHQEALSQHRAALALSQKSEILVGEAESYFYIAEVYSKKSDLNTALEYHRKSLHLREKLDRSLALAESRLGTGRVLQKLGEFSEALLMYRQALQGYRQNSQLAGQAICLNQLSTIFIAQNKYAQAIDYAKGALRLSEQLNDKNQMRASYEALYASHAAQKNFKEALEYKNLFVAISDLIYGEESERHLAERINRYEIAKKESEIAVLKKDNELRQLAIEKEANLRNFFLAGFILLLVILGLALYLYRQKRSSNLQLQGVNEHIFTQNQELQALNSTKDKFFSIISHDLKGPLNSLTSFSSLLINHTDALSREEIQMLASDLDRSLKNLLSLLENLLEWARSQSGSLQVVPEPIDLNQAIDSNIELLKPQAKNKEIELQLQLDEPITTFADRNLLNTTLRNLISNAIKFTEASGKIEIRSQLEGELAKVTIQDNGVGMSDAIMEKLFKAEYKFSTPGTANEKGTGLGLLLCKEFIERSGGTLSITSEEGVGSTFSFTLPLWGATKHSQTTLLSNSLQS